MDWYPAKAKRSGSQGRVLVEFKIDAKGRPTDASVLESDAEVLLQTHSLKMLQATLFDVADPRFNPADETPFRVTYRYCLKPCAPLDPYERSNLITISATRISR